MRGTYVIPAVNITLANQAVTLAFVNPGASATLMIRRLWASQTGTTTSAQQRVQYNTQVTAFPTLVSQAPVNTAPAYANSLITGATTGAAGTSGINASAEGAGAKSNIVPDAFNNLSGYLLTFTPDEIVLMSASLASGFGLHFPAAPGTLSGWNAGITFSEY